MKDHVPSQRSYRILLHQANALFAETWADVFSRRYPGHPVHVAVSSQQAIAKLEDGTISFCVLDFDAPGGADLFFDLRAVFPDIDVLLTSTRLPGERPTLTAADEARVLHLDADCTPALLCETVGGILGLERVPDALLPEPFERAALAPQTRRLSGNLQILLPDLVQLKCLTGRSCVLEINAAGGTGMIFFRDGNICHAHTPFEEGLPALETIFAWPNCRFTEHPWSNPPAHSIHLRWEAILLELSRISDETAQRATASPLTARGAGRPAATPAEARLAPLR